ncbi:amino acid adenylation domain-containing protein [Streptomyces ovatisporus]|uniref:Amino acid adenylation domain-containing protein n=1 Tax=Streptomyces ovatisporus TaxID=1128682 RepID=A0ABV9AC84_9ACTN
MQPIRSDSAAPAPVASGGAGPAVPEDAFPLTDMQEAYYVGRFLEPDSAARIYVEFDVPFTDGDGRDALAAMEDSWNRLVAETGMLRARILPDGRQTIRPEVPRYRLPVTDLRTSGPGTADDSLTRLRRRVHETPFDVHAGPLFAVEVAWLPGRARVHLALDELVVDGPSVPLLLRRWYVLYRGGPVPAAPVFGFREYVEAVRARENPARTEAALAYWREKLSGVRVPVPRAEGDPAGGREEHAERSAERGRRSLRLPADRWQRVTGHASVLGATPSALLLTLFGSLLRDVVPGAQAGAEDPVPLVITTYNRLPLHPDVPRVVGPFVSTSVFLAPPPAGSLSGLVGAVRRQLWADLERSSVSGVRALRERAAHAGDGPGAPPFVFTSMLGTLGGGDGDEDDGAWAAAASTSAGRTRTPGVWLECVAHEIDGELHLSLDYDEDALGSGAPEELAMRMSKALDTLAGLASDEMAEVTDVAALFGAAEGGTPGPSADSVRDGAHGDGSAVADARDATDGTDGTDGTEGGGAAAGLPLTSLQTAYLVGRMTEPGVDGETRVHQEFRLLQPDVRRLGEAWRLLVRRHPALRAEIAEDGTLTLRDAPQDTSLPRIPHHDLTHLTPQEAGRAESERRSRLAATPLPLEGGPLWHLETSALPDGSVVLHVLLDALVADARAVALLFQQLFGLHAGKSPEEVLGAPPTPFAAFLRARERALRSPAADAARAAWDVRLAGVPDGPAPARRAPVPATARSEHRRLDVPRWRALQERADAWGVPLDVVLLTVYCDVWRRACAQGEPFTVVVVSWDRPAEPPGAGRLVTDFTRLSWLVVDDTLPGEFGPRVRAVAERLRADLDRSAVADGLAAARARSQRHPGAVPPFPVVFTRLPAERPDGLAGVELQHSQSRTSGVAVDHVPMFVGDTLVCQWDVREGSLPEGLLDSLFADYAEALRQLAGGSFAGTGPGAAHATASGSGSGTADGARQSPLSGPARDFSPELTLADRLERSFAAHGDRLALLSEEAELSYRELGARSARLARFLRASGVRNAGDRVAVHMERSADLVTALLAVVRAGGAYVPLDPANPPARTRLLASDCEASLVLTDARCRANLDGVTAPVVTLDPTGDAYRTYDDGPLDSGAGPEDPAYMIYTSGTTGVPKGCPNSHRGVSNRLNWAQETFRLGRDDRVAQKTPYGFDVSVWEFFWPLLAGAAVVVARPDGHRSPAYLARWFRENGVTVAHFVPSMLSLFLDEPAAGRADTLRLVLASGEALPAPTVRTFQRVLPAVELHNLYGPTEAAVDVTHWAVPPGWSGTDVPLGGPIDNTVIHLLDAGLRPVAAGEPGEICVGGPAVGLGYHRRPEEEARRFVLPPSARDGASRLYRTGDLGRVDADGVLHYLGREDDQFKIRGLRVEAGEIEAALLTEAGVAQARVLPWRGPTGDDPQLAAVCVGEGDGAPPVPVAQLRSRLARTLPAHLIPSRLVFTDALPLTANGKLDREAATRLLDAPTGGVTGTATPDGTANASEPDARCTPAEAEEAGGDAGRAGEDARPGTGEDGSSTGGPGSQAVAAIAASLLGCASVDPDADLFALGATSFTMIRLARAIEQRYGARVPVDLLVTRPSARGVAEGLAGPEEQTAEPGADDGAPDVSVALDPEAKAAFKAERRSLRRFAATHPRLPLDLADDRRLPAAAGSVREFSPDPLSLRRLSLLAAAFTELGPEHGTRRPYPSAGGFYPVQVYVYVKPGRVSGVEAGVYYLDPAGRALVPLADGAVLDEQSQVRYNRPLFESAAVGFLLVSTPRAIEPAYGRALGRRYTAVEAGHMCQAAIERADRLGMGLCPIGDMDFTSVREHFGLDDGQELVVSLWGGSLPGEDDAPDGASTDAAVGTDTAAGTDTTAGTDTDGLPATVPGRGHVTGAATTAAAPGRDQDGGRPSEVPQGAVAVIGFAGLLPGTDPADSVAGLGRLLAGGGSAIGAPPPGREPSPAPTTRCGGATVGAYLPDVSAYEPAESGIPRDQAAAVDPQEHLLLTAVRGCLENAAVRPGELSAAGPVGVFTGAMWHDHGRGGAGTGGGPMAEPTSTGLAHRISHAFDFHGASLVVDAGCASGLAAVEAALRALRGGQCSTAVAAAVNLVLDGSHLQFLADAGLLAESADSRPFSGRSDGWIPGEGVGAVLLKPLERALADGDPVHAVLRGGACRHSGTTRAYGMPSPQLQEETVRAALADAGVTTGDIGYVESSATGAALADALELDMLGRVFGEGEGTQPVPVGSVKGSLGHMEAASAFGQLAKVLAQFRQDRLLPTVAADSAPPAGGGRVRLVVDVEPWPAQRRVLLNSFAGTGGYVSVVLEAPPRRGPARAHAGPVTLALSADAPAELARHARQLAEHLDREQPPLHAVGAALRRGRRARSCRAAVVATTGDGAVRALHTLAAEAAGHVTAPGGGLFVRADDTGTGTQPELPAGWLDGADAPWPAESVAPLRAALPATPVPSETTGPAAPVGSAPEPVAAAAAAGVLPQTAATAAAPTTSATSTTAAASAASNTGPVTGGSPVTGTPDGRAGGTRALERLVAIVVRETGVHARQLDESTDLIALGVDSLRLVRIAHAIAAEGGRAPSLTALYAEPVLGVLARSAFGPGTGGPAADPPALSDEDIDSLDESTLDALLARHAAAPRSAEET